MPDQPPKVFISYAHEDETVARRLYKDLKAASADPWFDKESLLPGQEWSPAISKAIRESDFFIALISSRQSRKRGYVQKELRECLEVLDTVPDGTIYAIPARVDECEPPVERFKAYQWVDLFPSYEEGLDRILRVVRPPALVATGALTPAPSSDEADLAQAGWGLILCNDDPPVRDALSPLLDLRRRQATRLDERLYREFTYETRPGVPYLNFLRRHGMGPGSLDPALIPSYLLIAGDPQSIPFEFEYRLAMQYRVGRIHFDTVDEYRAYAEGIVASEAKARLNPPRIAVVSPEHTFDRATMLANRILVRPLCESFLPGFPDWQVRRLDGEAATREQVAALMNGNDRPDLLFLIGHGLDGLLCSDWNQDAGRAQREHQFTADDLAPGTDLAGMLGFWFIDIGVPDRDAFIRPQTDPPAPQQPKLKMFVKQLLGRHRASAIIGKLDRAWASSFMWDGSPQIQTFASVLRDLMTGKPIGLAFRHLVARYAQIAAAYEDMQSQPNQPAARLENLRIAMLDARNYIIVGDPAARLNLR